MTIKNVLDYFKYFAKLLAIENNQHKNFSLKHHIIPETGFYEALQSMQRVKIADVYINKQLLGSDALNFSNRIVTVKNEMKLSISSNLKESIKSTTIDIFNKYNEGGSIISKIRVEGKDIRDNDVLIDTSFMNKQEQITIERNTDTGELATDQIYSELTELIKFI